MHTSIKIIFLLSIFNVIHTHSMEYIILGQEYFSNIYKTIFCENDNAKEFILFLDLPPEILGKIISHISKDDVFDAIQRLTKLSCVCKKLENIRAPDTLKKILCLDQKMLDDCLHVYAFLNTYKNRDFTPLFKVLICMGAKLDKYCKTLTSCVSNATNIYIIEHFITHHNNNNIDQQDKDGQTPLWLAIACNDANIARVLLKHNANIYLADNKGITPMHWALLYAKIECIKALIEYKIDPSIQYNMGNNQIVTIAEWAQINKQEEIYNLINNT